MNVLAVTIFISLVLAGIFICCFTVECLKKRKSSLEHDALLPLDDTPPPSSSLQSEICNLKSK